MKIARCENNSNSNSGPVHDKRPLFDDVIEKPLDGCPKCGENSTRSVCPSNHNGIKQTLRLVDVKNLSSVGQVVRIDIFTRRIESNDGPCGGSSEGRVRGAGVRYSQRAVEGKMDMASWAERRTHLENWIDRLLNEPVELGDEVRIRNRLRKQRSHWIGCLYELSAEPTNNRAERSLRPAVIARKISCGNKTNHDRRTWQVLASLVATCVRGVRT